MNPGLGSVAVILALLGLAVGCGWLYWLLGGVGWPMAAANVPTAMFLGFAIVLAWAGDDLFRVAGIYGPGRLPLERIRTGLPLVRPEDAPWSNRIHADDLVAACIAAMARGSDGTVYNVCDGAPSTMTDYFFQVAAAAGLPRPPVVPLAEAEGRLSDGMLSYMRESRRLSNRRLVENLGVELRYPNVTQGLRSCF